jgi:hypothetical protein
MLSQSVFFFSVYKLYSETKKLDASGIMRALTTPKLKGLSGNSFPEL